MRRISAAFLALAAVTTLGLTACRPVVVGPGPAVSLQVSGLKHQAIYAGRPTPSQVFVVEALDASGKRATGYDGTVRFGDNTAGEVLPADSTLTDGRGVFSANITTLAGDCRDGAPFPDCLAYRRVTATDTQDPSITGYQRIQTFIIVEIPIPYITPEGGVCTSCAQDPTGTVLIDTGSNLTINDAVIAPNGSISGTLTGTTIQGQSFTQQVTIGAVVGDLVLPPATPGGEVIHLDGVLVQPEATPEDPQPDLVVQGLGSLGCPSDPPPNSPPCSPFGDVEVTVPVNNPSTGGADLTQVRGFVTNFSDVICDGGTRLCDR